MAARMEVLRTPDQLAADLAELSTVDWSRVWPGYAEVDPRQWSAQFGWQVERLDRVENLFVRLGSGGTLYLAQDLRAPYPQPVTHAEQAYWSADAETIDDNDTVFAAADEAWPAYFAAARGALGDPAVSTAWDDPAFPESPHWSRRGDRLRYRRPYALAVWPVRDAVVELYLNPSDGTATGELPGDVSLRLDLRPDPVDAPAGGR
jgi:hypothetical protein